MNRGLVRLIAVVAALAVVAAGIAYIGLRSRDWKSSAELSVNPDSGSVDTQANLLGNLQESGTIGTRVELISSKDTLDAAGNPPVQITVRSIPDTRVIDVSATGAEDDVSSGLSSVLQAAKDGDSKLGDPWTLRRIASPTTPVLAGPSDSVLAAATVLLAILAGIATLAALRSLAPEPAATPGGPRQPKSKKGGDSKGPPPAPPAQRTELPSPPPKRRGRRPLRSQ
jgi:hypothetical protein